MKKALIVIDVQNDYFPGGKMELFEAEKALINVKKLVEEFRNKGDETPIYFIQHIADKGSSFFEKDTLGCEIHEQIKPQANEKVIIKHYPNSFLGTNLQDELQKDKVSEVVVCGMMTHMCVDTTVRAAMDYGLKVTLISDACATKNLKYGDIVVEAGVVQVVYMASLQGRFAEVMKCQEYLVK